MTTAVVRGRPDEAIADYAREHGCDAIVMGSHGGAELDPFLLGSVTDRVLERTTVPVLVVPTHADRLDEE